jgi:hypothetical protein
MRVIEFLVLSCAIASAGTLTNTSFGEFDSTVLGNPLLYDVQSLSVSLSGNQVTAVIDVNYGNQNGVISDVGGEQFLYGLVYGIGDLFFYDPSAPTTQSCSNTVPATNCVTVPTASSLAYAVVLDGSGRDLGSGELYSIGGDISTVTAAAVLALLPPGDDRPDQVVEVATAGSPSGTPGTETVTALCTPGSPGCGTTTAEFQVTLNFTVPSAFLSLLMDGQLGVEFSAADCGNAVIVGIIPVTGTPELDTLVMIAAGIGMLGLGMARRRRAN